MTTTTDATTAETGTSTDTARLVYIGVRTLDRDKAPVAHFVEAAAPDYASATTVAFKVSATAIGGIYEARNVVRNEGGKIVQISSGLRWTGDHADLHNHLRVGWSALDHEARRVNRDRLLENRLAKADAETDQLLAPLLETMRAARDYRDAERIANRYRHRLMDLWTKTPR